MRQLTPGFAVIARPLAQLAGALLGVLSTLAPAGEPVAGSAELREEQATVQQWRTARTGELTSDTGWLTLVGLLWLQDGANSFGRAASNALALDNPALAAQAGTFLVREHQLRFIARSGSGITHRGEPVTALDLVSDAAAEPTVLSSGPLRFFVIERAGKLGVRVRDLSSPRRAHFRGLSYFPVSTAWRVAARFEPYEPARRIKIINILGMEDELLCPGALVFTKDAQEWRLDAVLESPTDTQLFVMFQDDTSGHETYGGGRFMHVPMPAGHSAVVDFNLAYNPPCAFNDFATCPLPPPQNRLKLRVEAGELDYGHPALGP
jgi:uncharacterized protein